VQTGAATAARALTGPLTARPDRHDDGHAPRDNRDNRRAKLRLVELHASDDEMHGGMASDGAADSARQQSREGRASVTVTPASDSSWIVFSFSPLTPLLLFVCSCAVTVAVGR